MAEIIRDKWCDDLEDILQCPVCMERPKKSIYQCEQGHHICDFCKPQLSHCPTCAQKWSESRNRLAEHLCLKLDDIKLSLIDPEHEINKLLIPEKVSVMVQTDDPEEPAREFLVGAPMPNRPKAMGKKRNYPHHGIVYPCKIQGCNATLYYEPLLKHIFKQHATICSEHAQDGAIFTHSWKFEYKEEMIFERIFIIADVGIFFLQLSADIFGNFKGIILMVQKNDVANKFQYQLEISCCGQHESSLNGDVSSCLTPMSEVRYKNQFVSRADISRMIEHKTSLTCTLLLAKKKDNEIEDYEQNYALNSNNRHNKK